MKFAVAPAIVIAGNVAPVKPVSVAPELNMNVPTDPDVAVSVPVPVNVPFRVNEEFPAVIVGLFPNGNAQLLFTVNGPDLLSVIELNAELLQS